MLYCTLIQYSTLVGVVHLIAGVPSCCTSVCGVCSDKIFPEWYHSFVGQLLFVDPLVEANDSLVSHLAEVQWNHS